MMKFIRVWLGFHKFTECAFYRLANIGGFVTRYYESDREPYSVSFYATTGEYLGGSDAFKTKKELIAYLVERFGDDIKEITLPYGDEEVT
jgi:hypothetical protein